MQKSKTPLLETKNPLKNLFPPGKIKKIKERPCEICLAGIFHRTSPKNAPFKGLCLDGRQENITVDTAERSFRPLILIGISGFLSSFFSLCAPLTLKSSYQIARMMKGSCSLPNRWTSQPILTMDKPDGFIGLTMSLIGLTLTSVLTADVSVNSPDKSGDVLIRSNARLLATSSLFVDVDVLSKKRLNLLIINSFCQFFVDKTFELRSEVCDFARRSSDQSERRRAF